MPEPLACAVSGAGWFSLSYPRIPAPQCPFCWLLQVQLDPLLGMSLMAGKALSSARMADAVLSQTSLVGSQPLPEGERRGECQTHNSGGTLRRTPGQGGLPCLWPQEGGPPLALDMLGGRWALPAARALSQEGGFIFLCPHRWWGTSGRSGAVRLG